MKEIIKKLIESKKEGVYWDFKQEHHHNHIDFIHDIICLSNANCNGNRYLIFGIRDNGEICGIENSIKQADIIDKLRNAKFANDIFPDINLTTILLEEKTIDIIIIYNKPLKPYYLTQENKRDKKTLNAGTIYTRVMDTNTPKNRVASSLDIELMWKERFGLSQSPLDRFKIYLNNFKDWTHKGEQSFYKQHPEFTIQPIENDYCKGNETQEWARGEIGYYYDSGNGTSMFGFYYHATLLHEICCIQFDGGKKYIVRPMWEALGAGRIYFYLEDSFEYTYQKFIVQEFRNDFSKAISSTEKYTFDIPIFRDKNQLNKFLNDAKVKFKINELINPIDDENKQNELFYSYLEYYKQWKIRNNPNEQL